MASRMAGLARPAIGVALLLVASSASAEVVVSNVRAQELADGTNRVEVLYDLTGAPAGGATVSVAFSATGNAPYSITPAAAALSGDVGAGIASGSTKGILLDCGQTLAALGTMGDPASAVVGVDGTRAVHRPYRHLRRRSPDAEITVTLDGGVQLVMVQIPAGTFTMGSPDGERGRYSDEGPQHQVTITQPFYLGRTEVTQAQWQAVMGTAVPTSCGLYGAGSDYPVYCVSWNDICGGATGWSCTASSFIGRLNQQQGSSKFRLPTEAEWEHAARGGTTTEFSFAVSPSWDTGCGSFPEALPYMWWCGNNSPSGSKPVAQKLANPRGLFDMHGNLWEWVGDLYGSYGSAGQSDPQGPGSGSYRAFRGGGWGHGARLCRSAHRDPYNPGGRSHDLGFRLARSQ